jgi:hypothetical protein
MREKQGRVFINRVLRIFRPESDEKTDVGERTLWFTAEYLFMPPTLVR